MPRAASDTGAMRPCTRAGIFCAPARDGGVIVASSRGRFLLPGPDLWPWLQRLLPFLDGTRTVADLTRALDPARRQKVEALLRLLHRRGLIVDRPDHQAHTLSQQELRDHADCIAYIAEYAGAAERRFEDYRRRRVLLVGAGTSLLNLIETALRSGCGSLIAAVTDAQETDGQRLDELSTRVRAAGAVLARVPLAWQDRAEREREADLQRLVDSADLVLAVSHRAALALARTLDRVCRAGGRLLHQAIVLDGEAWLGPISLPEAPQTGWDAAWRRLDLAEALGSQSPAAGPRAGDEVLVIGALVLGLLRHVTGIDATTVGWMTRVHWSGPATTRHRFFAHPLALAAQPCGADDFRARLRQLQSGPEIDDRTFSKAAAACVDPHVGILREIEPRDFQQLPLWVNEARVSDPVGLLAQRGVAPMVHGAALEFEVSRYQAARAGLELYASAMLDRRLLLGVDGTPASAASVDQGTTRGAYLRGSRLDGGGEQLVAVDQVFEVRASAEDPALPWGVASGPTWLAAQQTGLLRRCQPLVMADARAARRPWPAIEPGDSSLDTRGARLLRILQLAGAAVTVHDVTGLLGIPGCVVYLGGQAIAEAVGWSWTDALSDGLQQAVLAYQARLAGQPAYAPPPVRGLPSSLRGLPANTSPTERAARPAQQVPQLLQALERRNLVPVAVPLDHDPALASALPYAVRVIFCSSA